MTAITGYRVVIAPVDLFGLLILGQRPRRSSVGAMCEASWFGIVEPEDFPAHLRERVGAIAEKSGFVPNIFLSLARRPAELQTFLDYHDALNGTGDLLAKSKHGLSQGRTVSQNTGPLPGPNP